MSADFVEDIVSQIRKRITEESVREAVPPRQSDFSTVIGTQEDYRERMAEDSRCFSDLEMRIAATAENIGKMPAVSPGRLSSWFAGLLRRLLWWYPAPIQETIELLNRRNREQAARHLRIQEQILSLVGCLQQVQKHTEAIETLRAEVAHCRNESWVTRQEVQYQLRDLENRHSGMWSEVTGLKQKVAKLTEQLTRRLEELGELQAQRELSLWSQMDEFNRAVQELRVSTAASDSLRAELAQRVTEAAHTVWGRLPVLETQWRAETDAREALAGEVKGQIDELKRNLDDLQARGEASDALRAELAQRVSQAAHAAWDRLPAFETRLRDEAAAREALAAEIRGLVAQAAVDGRIASLYAEFEDVFRGPRDEIKERLKVYIPRLEQAHVGSPQAPVLDLGCGRGEWLQLLSEHNLTGRGVDANPTMISRCDALGLEVINADALTHLRSLPDQSLGAITSFHMIEHLPFETVMAIVGEALRVLCSGGLLILETPNPANVLVGAQTFWIDPTHLHPILSQTLRFFVEASGFCQVEILNLTPYPDAQRLAEDSGVARWLNEYFYGPRDYSVIGRRP